MTLPAGPFFASVQFADVNQMATTPIENLSSATNVAFGPNTSYPPNVNPNLAPRVPGPTPVFTNEGALPPVYSKSGIIAFVEAEFINHRPPYYALDPNSTAAISPSLDPNYPYGDPGSSPGDRCVIAAQSSLEYALNNGDPFAAPASVKEPVHNPALPGRWVTLNIDLFSVD